MSQSPSKHGIMYKNITKKNYIVQLLLLIMILKKQSAQRVYIKEQTPSFHLIISEASFIRGSILVTKQASPGVFPSEA